MSTRVDALRNTLDHLALDPKASEDRRYLVSMLRRLGYSDAEIEAQIGPLGGEGPRVIEVEYEPAEGRAPERPLSRETTFEVAAPDDGLSFRLSDDQAPAGSGVEEVHHTDLTGVESDLGDWGDDYEQGPRDDFADVEDTVGKAPDDFDTDGAWGDDASDTDLAWGDDDRDRFSYGAEGSFEEAEPELVEFRVIKRPDPAVAAGWQDAASPEAPAAAPEASPAAPEREMEWSDSGSDDAWAAPEWSESESESEDVWAAPEAESAPEAEPETEFAAWPETSDEAGRPEAEAEELVPWPEAGPEDAPEDAWPVEEAPADAGAGEAPLQEAVETGQAGEETQPADAWEDVGPVDAWEDADAPAEAAAAPYTHGDYTLHTRVVHLSTGREQRIYFFAKNKPQSGEPCPLPDGYEVIENDKTGLPFLRRQR